MLKTPVDKLKEQSEELSAHTTLPSESYVEQTLPGILSTRDLVCLFVIVLFFVTNVGNAVGWWNYARPNLVGDPRISNPTSARWFNPDAFSVPVLSYGSFGRNVLRTDGVTNIDFSLFKNVPLGERVSVQFRAEAFVR